MEIYSNLYGLFSYDSPILLCNKVVARCLLSPSHLISAQAFIFSRWNSHNEKLNGKIKINKANIEVEKLNSKETIHEMTENESEPAQ